MARKARTVQKKALDTLLNRLESLPTKEAEIYTVKEAIERAAPQLLNLLDRGYSYSDLLKILEEESGVKIKLVTFKQYLRDFKKTKNPQSAKRSKANQVAQSNKSAQTTQAATAQKNQTQPTPVQNTMKTGSTSGSTVPKSFIEMDEENL